MWDEQGITSGQIQQVWFSGVHANVGGGYPKQGMSLVTLNWMMAEAEAQGLHFIDSDRESIRAHWDVNDKLYDSRAGLGVYYRWDPRDIAKICAENHIMNRRIHSSVFERIAQGTEGYAPGNIPTDLEVVGTPGTAGPTRLADIQKLVNTELSAVLSAQSSTSLLGSSDLQGWVAAGKLSYYGFLLLTIAGVYFGERDFLPALDGLNIPDKAARIAGWAWTEFSSVETLLKIAFRLLRTWWFYLGLVLCWGLAMLVDKKIGRRYSEFWYRLEYQLRALLLAQTSSSRMSRHRVWSGPTRRKWNAKSRW